MEPGATQWVSCKQHHMRTMTGSAPACGPTTLGTASPQQVIHCIRSDVLALLDGTLYRYKETHPVEGRCHAVVAEPCRNELLPHQVTGAVTRPPSATHSTANVRLVLFCQCWLPLHCKCGATGCACHRTASVLLNVLVMRMRTATCARAAR
jgi:hypothetical protein